MLILFNFSSSLKENFKG